MKVAIGLLALTLFGGCEAPLAGAPCPCLDGYVCDPARDVCIAFSDGGTSMDGAFPDGGFPASDGSGPVGDAATSEDGGSFPFDAGFDPDAGEFDGGPAADGGAARIQRRHGLPRIPRRTSPVLLAVPLALDLSLLPQLSR